MAILNRLIRKAAVKKAVFLDLDNTLYAYEPCHKAGLKAAFRHYSRLEPLSWRRFLTAYLEARRVIHKRLRGQAASHSRLLYFKTLLDMRFGAIKAGQAVELEAVYWKAFLRRMRLYTWVKPFLRHCRRQGKKVLLVTNLTTAIQLQKIQKFGLAGLFDSLVTSEEAGREKPAALIFKLALRKAGCPARDVLTVGDDPAADRFPSMDFFRV